MAVFALVHGGWHGGWCWSSVAAALRDRGHTAVTPDLPITDPAAGAVEYAAAVTNALGGATDVVLVAHSLAGLCAPLIPSVRRVVYLAGMLPVPGRSVDERARAGERMTRRGIGRGQTVNNDGSTQWRPEAAVELLYPDSPRPAAEAAAARLRPQHWRITAEPSPVQTSPAATYVLCRDDRIIDTDWARSAAAEVVEIDGDHSPFLARPDELADLLDGLP
ncbi:MAG TPA: alpha/beta hydrolase [Mycobacteriales bacterium]